MIALAALLAILVRLGGPLPRRAPRPGARYVAAYLDDRSWRAERLAAVGAAAGIGFAYQRLTRDDIGRVMDTVWGRVPRRPADPQSVWPLIGRIPEYARAAA